MLQAKTKLNETKLTKQKYMTIILLMQTKKKKKKKANCSGDILN